MPKTKTLEPLDDVTVPVFMIDEINDQRIVVCAAAARTERLARVTALALSKAMPGRLVVDSVPTLYEMERSFSDCCEGKAYMKSYQAVDGRADEWLFCKEHWTSTESYWREYQDRLTEERF